MERDAEIDSSRRLGDGAVYNYYFKSAGIIVSIIFALAMIVYAFCSAYPTVWLSNWSNAMARGEGENLGKWLGVYVLLGAGATIAGGVGGYQLFINAINNSALYFHEALVKTVSTATLSFFGKVDPGVTVNRFSQDLRLIDMELPSVCFGAATSFAMLVAQFIVVAVSSKYLGATIPVLAAAFYLVQRVYLRTSRQLRLLDIESKAPLYTHLTETLTGLITVRAFQWEDRFDRKNLRLLDDSRRPSYLLASVQCWLVFVVDMIVAGVAICFVTLASTLRDAIGPSSMAVGLTSIIGFSGAAKTFITLWVALEIAIGAVARVKTFTGSIELEGQDKHEYPPIDLTPKLAGWPTRGAVEIKSLTASYDDSGICLSSVSMSIQPGERVAVCGRTGSGKSSLTLCLLRLLGIDSGSITIDGIDLTAVAHDAVRERLVALPKNPSSSTGLCA